MARLYKQAVISDLRYLLSLRVDATKPSARSPFVNCSGSNNNKGGVLVHFWMVFVVPQLTSPAACEECVGAIFRDSVHTSVKNRSSVGYLLGLPVDIDSILINGGSARPPNVCPPAH